AEDWRRLRRLQGACFCGNVRLSSPMSAAGLSKGASNADRRRRSTMSRGSVMNEIRLPSHEEPVPAVTILDGEGRVVRVVPANEFRRGPILPRRHAVVIP